MELEARASGTKQQLRATGNLSIHAAGISREAMADKERKQEKREKEIHSHGKKYPRYSGSSSGGRERNELAARGESFWSGIC